MIYECSCHCGNITGEFQTEFMPAKLELRKCLCSFCIKHGAISASDPEGRYRLKVANKNDLNKYRFGLRTCDFVICSVCGVYMAAMLQGDGALVATININTLAKAEEFTSPPKRVNYENETASEKVSRRREKWTPAKLE